MKKTIQRILLSGLLLAAAVATACAAPVSVHRVGTEIQIQTLRLSWSNAYLVRGPRGVILIDAGSPGAEDYRQIQKALKESGRSLKDLRLIILTHGHADHGGGAAKLHEASGAPILMGAGDEVMSRQGKNRPLHPTSLTARFLKHFVDFPFRAFSPQLKLKTGQELDLKEYGIPGRVIPAPGHTPGSLMVKLEGGHVFVGDMVLGGVMGGRFRPQSPGRHYFHDDPGKAEGHLLRIINEGAKVIYPGHGGPIPAGNIREWLAAPNSKHNAKTKVNPAEFILMSFPVKKRINQFRNGF